MCELTKYGDSIIEKISEMMYNWNLTKHWRVALKAHNDKGIRAMRIWIETKKCEDTNNQKQGKGF